MRRPIHGYEGLYEVSDTGDVWSLARVTRHGTNHNALVHRGERMLRAQADRSKGYLRVTLNRDGKGKTATVHTLVLLAFVGPRPDGAECRHLNGDPSDNRLENLAWGTPRENEADKVRQRGPLARSTPYAKLTADQARVIREVAQRGDETITSIGKRFGISRQQVAQIRDGLRWRSL